MTYQKLFIGALVTTIISIGVSSICLGAIAVKEGKNPVSAFREKSIDNGSLIPFHLEEEYSAQNIQRLDFIGVSADIEIVSSTTDKIVITVDGLSTSNHASEFKIEPETKSGRLILTLLEFNTAKKTQSIKDWWQTSIEYKDVKAKIEIPDSLQHFDVTTVSGDLNFKRAQFENLSAHSISGDITGLPMSINDANFETISGDIELKFQSLKKARFQSVSGDHDLEVATVGPDIQIESVSGDTRIKFNSGHDFKIDMETVSGDLMFMGEELTDTSDWIRKRNLNLGDSKGRVSLESISGDFEIL